ncbi:MAG: DNA-3-methyladenine glycosylase 2 family protein [Eggerthellaceae bacterium]|nr:DNA-3-methyladenine glycosylase 2 family protein [Eggerthellaceae bacterium]
MASEAAGGPEGPFFAYGEAETAFICERCPKMAWAVEQIGHINRPVIPDPYAALVNSILGQQISTAAHKTIWRRLLDEVGEVTPQAVAALSDEELQGLGTTFRKVGYIRALTERVADGRLDLDALQTMDDAEVERQLVALPGIGKWTAEMIMTFSLQRPDVMSQGDLAIIRGLRMLYHHRRITPQLFERYRRRFSPHATVASLYLWAIAGGAIPGMRDYAPKRPAPARGRGGAQAPRDRG